ncbi:Uncharacterized protein HZ326_31386, partial [Fusarium oxysporum f. sp. albedinis]
MANPPLQRILNFHISPISPGHKLIELRGEFDALISSATSLSSITSSCGCAPIVPVLAAASSYCAYTSRTT